MIDLAYYRGDHAKALELCRPLIKSTGTLVLDKQMLGVAVRCYIALDQPQAAIDLALTAGFEAKEAATWQLLATAHHMLGQIDGQLAAGQCAVLAECNSASHWASLASIYGHAAALYGRDGDSQLVDTCLRHRAACLVRTKDLLVIGSKSAEGFGRANIMERMVACEKHLEQLAGRSEGMREAIGAMERRLGDIRATVGLPHTAGGPVEGWEGHAPDISTCYPANSRARDAFEEHFFVRWALTTGHT
eukprot:comp23598_c0_seq2/m.40084 comp23598_c0_seq2/g.40084  ORF comp23598_c0_seq2/g.40084 comp23598_c0_seq2/m.40084 type:complete len:247 (-) comp23598_c0_seq2:363-1103(-)